MSTEKISIRQIKAARALLAWSQEDMARVSGISLPTIGRIEAEDGEIGGRVETQTRLRHALEDAGIEFINGLEPGVRLRRKSKKKA